MKRALLTVALLAFATLAAAPKPAKLPDKPLASEQAFVSSATAELNARYKTPADAEKAGYFRYTNEDSTGAISYANLQWNSAQDPAHPQPSQLWYDVNGHLLGADYSVPLTAANAKSVPNLWGLNPGRWANVSPSARSLHHQRRQRRDGVRTGGERHGIRCRGRRSERSHRGALSENEESARCGRRRARL